ncbi:relaxase/mobilization nuclease domain-containing protein [Ectobacillus funiculus]|uniref:relaxase/mobilization nuclease domain-containing protein n=1 Tax=Ectobacillus funiculus TaxID=137993 RepID=UPI00101DFF5C|nr:relaxase/mobilization nuclease domain-containing protein [Ectobacillus funiculus]
MATIQRSNTKVANKLISYAERRAEVREGVNCPAEYAKSQMKATRELWGKNDGIQAHHIIQSFKPGEVTPEQANEIGQELAKEIAKGHEAVVYTHTDKDHVHNHIIINSVNYENGRKYNASKEELYRIREVSDRLCQERNLSVVKEYTGPTRYTLAEKSLLEKGKDSWKDEIRQVIDYERQYSKTYEDFKHNLTEKYGIEVKERGKNITFTHPDNGMKVRGSRLGNSYEKETLEYEFERQIEQRKDERGQERGNIGLSHSPESREQRDHAAGERIAEELGGQSKADGHFEGLRQRSDGQASRSESNDGSGIGADKGNQRNHSTGNDFDIEQARAALAGEQRSLAESFGKWQERNDAEQRSNDSAASRDPKQLEQTNERDKNRHADRNQEHEKQRAGQRKQVRTQDFEPDR